MNYINLEAVRELYELPPKDNGINENFYWAIHGNWPAISKILEAHFQASRAEGGPQSAREALEAIIKWRAGPEGPEVLFTEGAEMLAKVHAALNDMNNGSSK